MLAVLFIMAQSAGQAAPPPSPDVIVKGRSEGDARRTVTDLTAARDGAQIARWHDDLCPAVVGIDAPHAGVIKARLTAAAETVGLKLLGKSCTANVIVVFAGDSDAFTRSLLARNAGLFGDPKYGTGHQADREAILVPRPVRWLNVARTGVADGMRMTNGSRVGDMPTANTYGGGTRIHGAFRENSILSYVIVDAAKVAGITWQQLGDYVAFVTLARPVLTAQNRNSLLSIFAERDAGRAGPPALTGDDFSFLRSFYASDGSLSAQLERTQIQAEQKTRR